MNHSVELNELEEHLICKWEVIVKEVPSNRVIYVSNYMMKNNAEMAYKALKRKYNNG